MAALTKGTVAIKDGNGTLTSNNGVASDGTNTYPAAGILGADGATFLPAMATAATAGVQKITDGTNTAAVKAASTAAVATDPAVVTSLSPNSPISGAVTTAAPSYTTGTTQALSLDTAGNLRVNVVTGGGGGGGNVTMNDPAATTGTISAADSGSVVASANAYGQVVITGTPTVNSYVSATLTGYSTVKATLTSSSGSPFTGTIYVDTSEDGTTWRNSSIPVFGTPTLQSSLSFTGTATEVFIKSNVAGASYYRISCRGSAPTNSLAVRIQPGYGVEDVAIPGPVYASTNARRNSGVLHRNAITSADKLAAGGTVTISAVTESGSTLTAVATYATICPYNRWGNGTPSTVVTVTPTANQAVRLAWAQVANADGYDIFLGTTAGAPAWVGRVTEAQRASGGYIFSSVGTPTANSSPAGSIDVGIVGTGLASNVTPFSASNAYTPAVVAGVGAVSCVGYSRAHVLVKLAVTDLRSIPTLSIVPFLANQVSSGDWAQGLLQTLNILTGTGASLEQDFWLDVDGSTDLLILIDSISGQGAAASVWVELM